ncbi:MAG: TIGR03663 family protein [Verrucomicrobia bacterium]|nr:TIGR03663 family protein [Verrucomicrobiota bacterium]
MPKRQIIIPLLIVAVAALFRLALLDIKPPHFDEGINGWFCDEMAKDGFYRYDPSNYHGPLHFYVLRLFLTCFGRNLWALRMPVVIVGILTVASIFLFKPFFGRAICYLAALGMAISPAFTFYQRYAIHETWLVLFLILTFWGFLSAYSRPTPINVWVTILSIAGLVLTKETYIIHLLSFGLALLISWLLSRFLPPSEPITRERAPIPWDHVAGAAVLSCFLIIFFYSGTFLNWEGVKGLIATFSPWAKTGADAAGHGKFTYDILPWINDLLAKVPGLSALAKFKLNWYWIKLFLVYEPFALVGLIFSVRYICGGNGGLRFLAIYAAAAFLAYTVIPYKTPWCVISIAWPYFFLGAAAFVWLGQVLSRVLAIVLVAVALGYMTTKAVILNYFHYDDPKELYAYVQTFRDYNKFVDPIVDLETLHPELRTKLKGLVLLESYFPIPWVLDDIPDIGYYAEGDEKWPKSLDADFIAALDDDSEAVEQRLSQKYFIVKFRLRDGMDPCRGYLKYDTFKALFPNRAPDFEPPAKPSE